MGTKDAIILNDDDNVAVAFKDLPPGAELDFSHGRIVIVKDNIPFGHKLALRDIEARELIIKYGSAVGRAKVKILTGQHVHVHNVSEILPELLPTEISKGGGEG